eukprot:5649595-Prymnesium_polylepis.1
MSTTARAVAPAYQTVPTDTYFYETGKKLEKGEAVRMTQTDAYWSQSPQQGRENWWPTVRAEVAGFKMCATLDSLTVPEPPPAPPSPPPSPPPPSPPPSPPPPSPPPPSPP